MFVNLHSNHIKGSRSIRIVKKLHMKVLKLEKPVIYYSGFFGMMILIVGREVQHLPVGTHLLIKKQGIGC